MPSPNYGGAEAPISGPCALLDKPQRRAVEVAIDFVGFSISDVFVVGYGTDYAEKYRHLPYIGAVE
jgi:hypoxanthine phosphoribosyltransferase